MTSYPELQVDSRVGKLIRESEGGYSNKLATIISSPPVPRTCKSNVRS